MSETEIKAGDTVPVREAASAGGGAAPAAGPFLSFCIPCYNEEAILGATCPRIVKVLEAQGVDWELIFGDDGSTDRTLEIIKGYAAADPRVRYTTHFPNKGPGAAYKDMYQAARGEIIMMTDCDLAMTPEVAVPTFLEALKGAEVVIGSRYKGVKADYPLKRRVFSWGYIAMNRVLFNLKVLDTQTGSIGFYRRVLPQLDLRADGPEMLLEFIAQAGALDLKVEEVPLPWVHDTTSGETPVWRTSAQMLAGTLRLRRRYGSFKRRAAARQAS